MERTALTIFQKGFNYSQDGPGNRLVYHLQGCNMACRWCANPEGIPQRPPLMVMKTPLPAGICPHGAVRDGALDRAACTACSGRECVALHPNDSLVCRGKSYPVEALVSEVLRSRGMFFEGGGVTLTGGEPTRQFEAVRDFLTRLKAEGINTAMESNGTHPALPELFPLLDTLIMDFKHPDTGVHRAFTGVGNETIRENIRRAAGEHPRLMLRVPLIGGFNVGEEELAGFLAFFRSLREEAAAVRAAGEQPLTLEFLRYHEFGKQKWEQCGLVYSMEGGFVSDEWVKRYEEAFRADGFAVIHT